MSIGTGKHIVFSDDENVNPERKRRRLEDGEAVVEIADITSPESLKKILAFQQDATSRMRQNIQTFKKFLDSILYGGECSNTSGKLEILLEYVQSTMPVDGNQVSVPLPDVIRAWSFANQSNHDGLLSAIPAVLALLLKTISSSIEFRKFGTQLCEALLCKDQIRLFDRGLTANKSKSHLYTPCLRLLTEIVSFDGGRLARTVYTQRDVTFKRLDVFLSMRDQPPKPVRGRLRHSVRHIALTYLLSNFRFQGKNVKAEILSESKLVRALFQGLSEDPPNLISEILNSVMNFIMRDTLLSKRSKSRLLTDWSLAQISRLYEYSEESTDIESGSSVQVKAHSFLTSVCTSLDHGVLVQQDGWYPPGFTENTKNSSEPGLAIVSSKLGFQDRYIETVPVRNVVLASFLQILRPYANFYHKRLILAVFAVAPELIADYFYVKKNFSFDSKLSATWVGYSSFLFSVIKSLPPPALHDSPPPVAIALESILPHPMNQKVLTRCLTQTTELITFLAVRLLIVAFQKVESILRSWAHREGEHWTRAASLLKARFCQRCPELKHVITAFRTVPEEKGILRESLLRLLAFYYKVTPGAALIEKLDVSMYLTKRLSTDTSESQHEDATSLLPLELKHLLDIACRSPDMAWWQKPVQLSLSPFTSTLRFYVIVHNSNEAIIRALLCSLVREHSILQEQSTISGFDALAVSLARFDGIDTAPRVYEFLDNCILRFIRKSIKYCGDADKFFKINRDPTSKTRPVSLLHFVLLEQWPFLVAANESIATVGDWIASYISASTAIGEDSVILQNIRTQMWQQIKDKNYGTSLKPTSNNQLSKELLQKLQRTEGAAALVNKNTAESIPEDNSHKPPLVGDSAFRDLELPKEDDDHPGLNRWSMEDVATAVEGDALIELVYCLCSEHREVRRQALINLRQFVAKLKVLGDRKYEQLILLLLEVVESAKSVILDRPLTSFAGALATRSVEILSDPLHFMYTKINKFLNKNPDWNLARLPSYWLSKILTAPPTDDDSHSKEVMWLLENMIEGLRNFADMESYRRCNVFELILSYAAAPSISAAVQEIIMKLVYRSSLVGGSTTLITRCGVLSWIRTRQARNDVSHVTLHELASQILKTCDSSRVTEWSGEVNLNLDVVLSR